MALSNEDKGDVKKAMGAAMANKVSKVTRDKKYGTAHPDKSPSWPITKSDDGKTFGAKSKALSKKTGEGKRTNTHNHHGNKWGSPEAIKDWKRDYGHK